MSMVLSFEFLCMLSLFWRWHFLWSWKNCLNNSRFTWSSQFAVLEEEHKNFVHKVSWKLSLVWHRSFIYNERGIPKPRVLITVKLDYLWVLFSFKIIKLFFYCLLSLGWFIETSHLEIVQSALLQYIFIISYEMPHSQRAGINPQVSRNTWK